MKGIDMSNDRKVSIKTFFVNLLYVIDLILPPPSKIILSLCVLSYFGAAIWGNTQIVLRQTLSTLLDYILLCSIADLIYYANKKRRLGYKLKQTQKLQMRLQKIMDTHYRPIVLLNEAKELAEITNKTTNEAEFHASYDRLIEIFRELSSYENTGIFTGSPTDDLNRLLQNRAEEIRKFYLRQAQSNHSFTNFDNMNGIEFEHFCADLLTQNGYINVEVTQGSGDHGIDILAEKDDITYAIQCKCYSSNIGNAAVQQAHTGKSLYHKDIAVVLTNQYFTQQAQEEANALGVKLWDRNKLEELINNQ